MAKKEKPSAPGVSPAEPAMSPERKKVVAGGVGMIMIGFLAIGFTDPLGRNWASFLGPFFIVLGYGVVLAALFLPFSSSPKSPKNQQRLSVVFSRGPKFTGAGRPGGP